MDLLAFKLVVTPLLLCAASLAIRRWGESVGGFFVGLPLTSGPISAFLAVERGPAFAVQATSGSLAATAAQAAFVLAYCRLAHRGWPLALAGACAAFGVAALPVQGSGWPRGLLFALALAAMAAALRFSPQAASHRAVPATPWWDIPARMALMAGLVVAVTALAPWLGAQASGLLASFPFMAVILTVFAHRMAGPAAAQRVMRGLAAGLLGFAVFFYVLSVLLARVDLATAYGASAAAALGVQTVMLRRLARRAGRDACPPAGD